MTALARRAHPLVWAAIIAVCGLLFLLGALNYRASDREVPPGTMGFVQVHQVATSEAAAVAALQRAADTHHVNLLLVGSNPAGPDAPAWYFAFVGDRGLFDATFPGGSYPGFSPHSVPRILPASELIERAQPIRGTYAVQGDDADRFAVADALNAAGLDVSTEPMNASRNYLSGLFALVTWPILVTVMLALGVAVVYATGLSRKASALQQLHGYRSAWVVYRQATDLAVAYLAVAATTVILGSATLAVYNHGHQFARFMPWALLPMAGAGVVAIGIQLIASTATLRLPANSAVKGARPAKTLALAAGTSYVTMLVLVFMAIVQAVSSIASIARDSRGFAQWEAEGDSVVVQINPNAFEDPRTNAFAPEVAAAYASFGRVFQELDADGSAVLSFHQTDADTGVAAASISSYEPLSGNSLIVNNNYLARHPIKSIEGREITAVTPAPWTIRLLIPQRLAAHARELSQKYADVQLAAWDPIGHAASANHYTVTTELIADDQAIFNYGNTWHMNTWAQKNPVVAVISPQSHYISDWILLGGAANDGNVIFTNPDEFRRLTDQAGLTSRLAGINSPASNAAYALHERETRLIIGIGNTVMGLLALLLSVALLSAIYTDAVRFSSFLKRTHGSSGARIHAPFVAIMASLSAAVIILASIALRPVGLASITVVQTTAIAMSSIVAVVIGAVTFASDRRAQAALITRK